MRFLALSMLMFAIATPAVACPIGTRCIVESTPREEVAAPRRPLTLHIRRAPERTPWQFSNVPRKRDAAPQIWHRLRREVKRTVPTYGGASPAPLLIDSKAFDTKLTIGISIDF